MDNHLYNLLLQTVEENKSRFRIERDYLKDADSCDECRAFWKKLQADKEEHVKELSVLIKNHLS